MAENQSNPTDFVAPSLEELGPLFPAYELEAFIAQGGMGAVYKARQKSLDRSVAIKILPREFGDDPQFRSSFEAEAKAMARLNHPNLISVYDFGDIEGMLYIIMEFVQGKALYYSAHNKAIDPAVALDLVSTISRGLAHAHRGGIIHRDIKPANILLDADAKPKIGDFGLAHPVDRGNDEGLVFGTPGYTAPEIFQNGTDVDQRSDIFSVGALLYELLCGRHPEPDSHGMTTGIDPRIDTILKRATNLNPNLRYPDVDELADDLDALIPKLGGPRFATAPAAVQTPTLGSPPILSSSKQKSGIVPMVIILFLLLGGGAAAIYIFSQDSKEPQTQLPEKEPEAEPDLGKKTKNKERPKRKPREGREKMASKDKPAELKPREPKPPEPAETPLESLARLKDSLTSGGRDEFPIGTITGEKSAYFLLSQNMSWDEANNFAITHGAHLAILPTTVKLAWFHENFKSSTPIWTGASDSGFENKWFWNDGSPVEANLWAENSPDNLITDNSNGEDFAAISSGTPQLEDHHRLQKLPSLLEWNLDGSQPASLKAQLARTGAALDSKQTPTFPSGTYNVGGSRFLLVEKSSNWEDASLIASNAGGHLAVPSNENEASFIALTLKSSLRDPGSCWIGGKRDEGLPEIWKYVTGEVFTFVTWLGGQPDNFDEKENYLVIRREGAVLGASDEDQRGTDTNHFMIEWSVPALRNMPNVSANGTGEDTLLADLEKIRDKIRFRHGRAYERFRKDHDGIVEDFLKDTIDAINSFPFLGETIKDTLLEEYEGYLERKELPDSIPEASPGRLKRKLKEAKEETKILKEEYEDEFKEAKRDYLDLLTKTANSVLRKGEANKGRIFILENKVTTDDDDRFEKIMESEKVPLPVEPTKEDNE
ncbi:MAG: protein kinase [Akkermansiaceae bacterium]